jgi:membrane-associated phospholipid phosphatase
LQDRDISWTKFVPNVGADLKQIFMFPVSVARGRHIRPVLAVTGITAGIIAIEEHNKQAFKRTRSFDGFNRVFSGSNTARASGILPAAFYLVSLARRDVYGQKTFWLAGEAVLDSTILTTVMKDIDRRWRPCDVPLRTGSSDTWFEYKRGNYLTGLGSFPSGHTIAAFSLATVFAHRYPKPRWRAWVWYGLASLVGFSRISLQSHFPSDVFVGGTLGYVIGRNVVLRR